MSKRVAAASLVVSAACVAGIAAHEGYVGQAYRDPVGIWTIGYGETHGVQPGQTTTKERAMIQLKASAQEHAKGMAACIHVPVYQYEFDAYADFTYNLGVAGFCRSSVATKLNAQDYAGACAELLKFVYAKGRCCPGSSHAVERSTRHVWGIDLGKARGGDCGTSRRIHLGLDH